MIDKITIRFDSFSGSLDNCRPQWELIKKESDWDKYRLPRSAKKGDHSLFVGVHKKDKKKVVVSGSLRNWLYGKSTFRDLTASDFEKVILKLAEALYIQPSELGKVKFTQCEIGLNVKIKTSCKEIIPKIVDYHRYDRTPYKDETVYFDGTCKHLKIYDKTTEVAANTKDKELRESIGVMQVEGDHILRIEFTLDNKKAFNQSHMSFIKTIGDLHINYSNLYEFWAKNVNDIVIMNALEENNSMTPKEYLFLTSLIGLDQIESFEGVEEFELFAEKYERFLDSYLSYCKGITDGALKTARSKAYTEFIATFDKYPSSEEYNKKVLRGDIILALLRQSIKDDSAHFPTLVRSVCGIKSNNK